MRHRIRSAVLIVQDESLLLVKHQHPTTGDVQSRDEGYHIHRPEKRVKEARTLGRPSL